MLCEDLSIALRGLYYLFALTYYAMVSQDTCGYNIGVFGVTRLGLRLNQYSASCQSTP